MNLCIFVNDSHRKGSMYLDNFTFIFLSVAGKVTVATCLEINQLRICQTCRATFNQLAINLTAFISLSYIIENEIIQTE